MSDCRAIASYRSAQIPSDEFATRVDFKALIATLVQQSRSPEKLNRVAAIEWLHQLIKLGQTALISVYPILARVLLRSMSETVPEIIKNVIDTSHKLMHLVERTTEPFPASELIKVCILHNVRHPRPEFTCMLGCH